MKDAVNTVFDKYKSKIYWSIGTLLIGFILLQFGNLLPPWLYGIALAIVIGVVFIKVESSRLFIGYSAVVLGLATLITQINTFFGMVSTLIAILSVFVLFSDVFDKIPGVSGTKFSKFTEGLRRFWWVGPVLLVLILVYQPVRIMLFSYVVEYPHKMLNIKVDKGATTFVGTRIDGEKRYAEVATDFISRFFGDIEDSAGVIGIDEIPGTTAVRMVGRLHFPKLGIKPNVVGVWKVEDSWCDTADMKKGFSINYIQEEDGTLRHELICP